MRDDDGLDQGGSSGHNQSWSNPGYFFERLTDMLGYMWGMKETS